MTEPRFDANIAYRIPTGLFVDIQDCVGLLTPGYIRYLLKYPYTWRTGCQVKRMLNMLNKIYTERSTTLASELYLTISEVEYEPDQDCLQ